MHRGHVKDWRKEWDSAIWQMPPLHYKVWKYLVKRANWEDGAIVLTAGGTIPIKRGQFLTSLRNIAQAVSWVENNKRVVPNPNAMRRVLSCLEDAKMVKAERLVIRRGTRLPEWVEDFEFSEGGLVTGAWKKFVTPSKTGTCNTRKPLACNTVATLITIVNYCNYQTAKSGLVTAQNPELVTPSKKGACNGGLEKVCNGIRKKDFKKKESCAHLDSLTAHLGAAPDFCNLPSTTQALVAAFLNKVRTSNKTLTLAVSKTTRLLADLVGLVQTTSTSTVDRALEITLARADQGKVFLNGKRDPVGYVRAIVKDEWRKAQESQKPYAPVFTDTDALYE